jgi:hypothetical protein
VCVCVRARVRVRVRRGVFKVKEVVATDCGELEFLSSGGDDPIGRWG